jgi:hypothetical protein
VIPSNVGSLTFTQLANFVSSNGLQFPVVLGQASQTGSELKLLLKSNEISKEHDKFVTLLETRAAEAGLELK